MYHHRVDNSIRLTTLRNCRITARNPQMRYLGHHGSRVSVQTIRKWLHASQLKSRKAAQKPLLTAGVIIQSIDDQSCLWTVALLWAIYFVVIMPLGHNDGHMKGN